jgi:hypothetical protein
VRVNLAIILDPAGQFGKDRFGVRQNGKRLQLSRTGARHQLLFFFSIRAIGPLCMPAITPNWPAFAPPRRPEIAPALTHPNDSNVTRSRKCLD